MARSAPLLGFNEDPTGPSLVLQRQLGVGIRRIFVGWNTVEPLPGIWRWDELDAHYDSLLANGLRPLIVVTAAPCWANLSVPCTNLNHFPPDRHHDRDWMDFVSRLTARYPAAAGIEVWNEPNLVAYFAPRVDPARYAALLKHAYTAVKAVNPEMPVVSGGLFASSISGPAGMADDTFVTEMYAAGARGALDAIGVHPYPYSAGPGSEARYDLPATEHALTRVRLARDAAGTKATPLWITEVGIATARPTVDRAGQTETTQADGLMAMIRAFRTDADIGVVVIHRLVDGQFAPFTSGSGLPGFGELIASTFGVFRADATPKPAACRISREFNGSLLC